MNDHQTLTTLGLLYLTALSFAGATGGPTTHISISVSGFSEQMPQKCKGSVGNLIVHCFLEMSVASSKFGISFPPDRSGSAQYEITPEHYERFASTTFVLSSDCCEKLCSITEEHCLCNIPSAQAVHSLFVEEQVFRAIYGKFAASCGIKPVAHAFRRSCEQQPTICSALSGGGNEIPVASADTGLSPETTNSGREYNTTGSPGNNDDSSPPASNEPSGGDP